MGVPYFETKFESKTLTIYKYVTYFNYLIDSKSLSNEDILNNAKADLYLKLAYRAKFPEEFENETEDYDIWSDISELSSHLENYYEITGNEKKKEIFSQINKLFEYSEKLEKVLKYAELLKELNNGQFDDVLRTIIFEIPYVNEVSSFMAFVDSKEFHQASLVLFNKQYYELLKIDNQTEQIQNEENNLLKCMKNAQDKIELIEQGEYSEFHNNHCTCF